MENLISDRRRFSSRDRLTQARAFRALKADSSEAGDAWSDSQIATALDTSVDTIARTRQQLVEKGLEAVLVRKHSPASPSATLSRSDRFARGLASGGILTGGSGCRASSSLKRVHV
jgi:hypothetical protein